MVAEDLTDLLVADAFDVAICPNYTRHMATCQELSPSRLSSLVIIYTAMLELHLVETVAVQSDSGPPRSRATLMGGLRFDFANGIEEVLFIHCFVRHVDR